MTKKLLEDGKVLIEGECLDTRTGIYHSLVICKASCAKYFVEPPEVESDDPFADPCPSHIQEPEEIEPQAEPVSEESGNVIVL